MTLSNSQAAGDRLIDILGTDHMVPHNSYDRFYEEMAPLDVDANMPDMSESDDSRDGDSAHADRWQQYVATVDGQWEYFCAGYGYYDSGVNEVLNAFAPQDQDHMSFLESVKQEFSGYRESSFDYTDSLVIMSSALKDSETGEIFPAPDEITPAPVDAVVNESGEVVAPQWSPTDHLRWKMEWHYDHGMEPELFIEFHRNR